MKVVLTGILFLLLSGCHSSTSTEPTDQDHTDMKDTVVRTGDSPGDSMVIRPDSLSADSTQRR